MIRKFNYFNLYKMAIVRSDWQSSSSDSDDFWTADFWVTYNDFDFKFKNVQFNVKHYRNKKSPNNNNPIDIDVKVHLRVQDCLQAMQEFASEESNEIETYSVIDDTFWVDGLPRFDAQNLLYAAIEQITNEILNDMPEKYEDYD